MILIRFTFFFFFFAYHLCIKFELSEKHLINLVWPSYAQNTMQRLANLRPEGERDGPKLPDCS